MQRANIPALCGWSGVDARALRERGEPERRSRQVPPQPRAGVGSRRGRVLRAGLRRARVERARALQHRRRRLRQAPARRSRRWSGSAIDGATRELDWGELQDLSNQAAHLLRAHGIEKGDRVAVVLPPTPETAAIFFGTWKLGAILLSMSVLYGDDGIRHRLEDATPKLLVTDAANAPRFDASLVDELLVLDDGDGLLAGQPDRPRSARTPPPTTRPSSTTRPAPPARRRASSTPTATSSPTRSSSTATTSATASASTAWASGPGRRASPPCSAPGASARSSTCSSARPASSPPTSSTSSPATGHERVHDPDRDAGDDGDRRRRRALPAGVPDRLLGRRAAEPGGDPLVSRPVRGHGARLLRAHRVLSAVRELPLHGGARGLDGPADAGLGRADPRRGRATRSSRASAARSACAPAPTRTTRSATGTSPTRPRRPSAASGFTPRTRRRWTRTATSGTRAAPTT